eukprot:NODE_2407_length_703_cov_921.857798_g1959_i0.p1 GENE.NODE_2407_length_703_cov_921.857798_g1959_i0~~NODE_2407_length_703_cov_921.857798_g1959_i0.p1  ORF type:complete len:134 (+),score=39.48 NODE_2407_length_703_cov_921.857798_g1959_i0:59-403(+)
MSCTATTSYGKLANNEYLAGFDKGLARNVLWNRAGMNVMPYGQVHIYAHPALGAEICAKDPDCVGFVNHFANGDTYLFKAGLSGKTTFAPDSVWNAFVKRGKVDSTAGIMWTPQ